MYKRVLLKLSGEQLEGNQDGGFDSERALWIAGEVKKTIDEGVEVVIIVGGGNYARGAQLASHGISRVTADNIGMLGTMMNGIALSDVFTHAGLNARVLSNIKADQVVDQFTHRRAISHLQKNRVVIVAGGIGRPYLTTDTAAVSLALELDCDVILKATKVDGVYDKDPYQHKDAVKYESLELQEAVARDGVRVMDKAALGLAMEQHQPVIVFALLEKDNIKKAATGQAVGTLVK